MSKLTVTGPEGILRWEDGRVEGTSTLVDRFWENTDMDWIRIAPTGVEIPTDITIASGSLLPMTHAFTVGPIEVDGDIPWYWEAEDGPEVDIEKHHGPGPHATGTTQQEAHGEGQSGEKQSLRGVKGRGEGHTFKDPYNEKYLHRSGVSRDTVRRRLNALKKAVAAKYGLPPGLKVQYWLDWEKFKDEVPLSEDGSYPMARFQVLAEGKEWEEIAIVISPSVAIGLFDESDRYGLSLSWRTVLHEMIHASSYTHTGRAKVYPGQEQQLEEGMAEILSLRMMLEDFDPSEFEGSQGWDGDGYTDTPGAEGIIRGSVYKRHTAGLIMHAAEQVGWDREAILTELQRRWDDPEAYLAEDWDSYEYLPHEAETAEQVTERRIADAERAHQRLISTTSTPEHIPQWEAEHQELLAYIREGAGPAPAPNWQYEATQRFQSAVQAAGQAGIDVDAIRHVPKASDQEWIDMETQHTGRHPTVDERAYADTVADSLLWWLFGQEGVGSI
jgi:hypothetical protein